MSRLVADVLLVGYVKDGSNWTESQLYLAVVWGMTLFGVAVLLAGFDQPLTLVVLAAALSGMVMFVYSILLILINRRFLPEPLKIRGYRLVALVWAVGLFGVLSVVVIIDQGGELFYASSAATSSTDATASGVVRKLTKHARRQARPSRLAGAR